MLASINFCMFKILNKISNKFYRNYVNQLHKSQGRFLVFTALIEQQSWFENKLAKTKADGEAKVAEAKARATVAEKVAAGEVAWEGKMADATVDSWKDEFALVVLLAPAILVFIPGMREYVQSGFEVLATLPDWYQYLLYIAISASFGIKGVGQAARKC